MEVVPKPDQSDIPFNEPVARRLDPGERLVATFAPEQATTEFVCPALGISKHPEMRYSIWSDNTKRYDAPVPPTDPDDMGVTFMPALQFHRELKVTVENLSSSSTRPVTVQPIGWELGGTQA